MKDRQIDELLSAAAPITDEAIADIDLAGLEAELKEEIMSTPVLTDVAKPIKVADPTPPRRTRRIFVAAAVAAVVVAGMVVVPFGGNGQSAWAAEAVAVARSSSRLLVDLPGWEVSRAHTFTVEEGEMTFTNGSWELDLHWRPAAEHADRLVDREMSAESVDSVSVNGTAATQFRYAGTNDYTTLWLDGGHSYEARGVFTAESDYQTVIGALQSTDVDEWLSAMPESVVKPEARQAIVAEMLEGIPLPAGFDVEGLAASTQVSDRYQLGAAVSGSVACAWITQWLEARATGDDASEAEALEAMQTSQGWSVLQEMQESGAYPQILWLHVDAMEGDDNVPGAIPVAEYQDALGC
ncbi:MAG: hypothetical protein HKN91_05995 [Acidimicrobiia bacterium]|nr:hypothetical protein [Acidimicrobiia bacterium]